MPNTQMALIVNYRPWLLAARAMTFSASAVDVAAAASACLPKLRLT
jgi:hypothetical protein